METKRDILESVAAGEITPQEGAERLAVLEDGGQRPQTPPPAPPASELTKVRLVTALGTAHVIGDPTVADAVADGDHTATRNGDVLTIEVTQDEVEDGDGHFRFESGKRRFVLGGKRVTFGDQARPKVTIRMNPALALEAEVGAGKLAVADIHGPITAEVAMGSLRVEGARAPFDIKVAMGSAHVSGRLDAGEARVRCDMGSAQIDLSPGSSAKVRARTSMGKVALPGVTPQTGIGGGATEAVVGDGAALLEIECAMGSVKVNAQ